MKKYALSFLLLALSFVGCGYKPSTQYTHPILGDKIETSVSISITNPTDSIFLKDALNEAVLSVFNAKVTNNDADSQISLKVSSAGVSPLDYDKNGYAILYRANASITAYVKDVNGTTSSYSGSGSYDFSVESESVVTDEVKHNAIKEAFLKALQMIEFKIANRGMNNDN
jgi:hypothetical protein